MSTYELQTAIIGLSQSSGPRIWPVARSRLRWGARFVPRVMTCDRISVSGHHRTKKARPNRDGLSRLTEERAAPPVFERAADLCCYTVPASLDMRISPTSTTTRRARLRIARTKVAASMCELTVCPTSPMRKPEFQTEHPTLDES